MSCCSPSIVLVVADMCAKKLDIMCASTFVPEGTGMGTRCSALYVQSLVV